MVRLILHTALPSRSEQQVSMDHMNINWGCRELQGLVWFQAPLLLIDKQYTDDNNGNLLSYKVVNALMTGGE